MSQPAGMNFPLFHRSLQFQAFETLSTIFGALKQDPMFDTLQLHQAYGSQDQEYEKNEFYGDSYLEERVSSLILQFLPAYEEAIPIEVYSGLRIHTVKNQTLGEVFELLHLGDVRVFERKSLGARGDTQRRATLSRA